MEAPASSSNFLVSSALSFDTLWSTNFGNPSTKSFASLSPKEVILRITLITFSLFEDCTFSIITSNSVFSSTTETSCLADPTFSLVVICDLSVASTPKVSSS